MRDPGLPAELATLVRRYGTRVLEDADGLRAMLDDFLDEGTATAGEVNLLIDAVRFGALERLATLLDHGAEPVAAVEAAAEALAQQRGGDGQSAFWACAVLGYAAGLTPGGAIPGAEVSPPAGLPPAPSGSVTSPSVDPSGSAPVSGPVSGPAGGPAGGPTGGPTGQRPDDETVSPGSVGRPAVWAGGSGGGGEGTDHPRTRRSWALAGVAAVVVVVVASAAYFALKPTGMADARHTADLADVEDRFGHFGGNLLKAVDGCNDATTPTRPKKYTCAFREPYNEYDLELSEQDPAVSDADGDLPDLVRKPKSHTLIVLGPSGKDNHAHVLRRVKAGDSEDTSDDVVTSVLYDVSSNHPGAASATFKSSDTAAPLTKDVANDLLSEIAVNREEYPLPEPFESSSVLEDFAEAASAKNCERTFTSFKNQLEQDECVDGDFTLTFGLMNESLDGPRNRYRSANQTTWPVSDSNDPQGRLIQGTTLRSKEKYLYWDLKGENVWGVLTSSDEQAKLLEHFKGFDGSPTPK